MIQCFDPIAGTLPSILILGSAPSRVSLVKDEYYGNQSNRFWKIISQHTKTSFITYDDKIKALKGARIALWDVIANCERAGSLDSNIRNVQVNPIDTFINNNPTIKLVVCNGKKSYDLYCKYFTHIQIPCICMPSTSNANQSKKPTELINEWLQVLSTI